MNNIIDFTKAKKEKELFDSVMAANRAMAGFEEGQPYIFVDASLEFYEINNIFKRIQDEQ